MYKPRHFGWKLMHVSGILANLGLTTAAAISYIHNLVSVTGPVEWNSMDQAVLSVNSMDPCRFALISGLGRWNPSDAAVRTLLVTCLVVGSLGAVLNIAIFLLLLSAEAHRITLTEGEQHWRKVIVTFFGCVLNLVMAGAGGGLAVTLGIKTAESRLLIAPIAWASIQAPLSLAMAVCDAVKTHREGMDLLD